jgi:hypothetical protein
LWIIHFVHFFFNIPYSCQCGSPFLWLPFGSFPLLYPSSSLSSAASMTTFSFHLSFIGFNFFPQSISLTSLVIFTAVCSWPYWFMCSPCLYKLLLSVSTSTTRRLSIIFYNCCSQQTLRPYLPNHPNQFCHPPNTR